MKPVAFYDFFNQRKLKSHTAIFLFALLVTIVLIRTGKIPEPAIESISTFIMLYIQLELFILLGGILFSRVDFARRPGIITRIVILRFMVFLAACLVISMTLFIILKAAVQLVGGGDLSGVLFNFFRFEFGEWFKSTLAGLSSGAIIFIILLWQDSLRREQKLREENLIFQNETLKSQVNPHFLFNSLNTISSLIQTQPEAAERFVSNLSSIYRYILENGQKDKVPLKSELNFITSYYNMHRIRDEEKIVLQIDIPDADRFMLIPVSLQILLENAIKHNSATRENPLKITITIEDHYIIVKNNLQRKATQLVSTRKGLKNLSERTRLITKRELIIEESENYFTVKLPLIK